MSVSVTVAGVTYTIPEVGDTGWGPQVTAWIQAISSATLQTTGGTFTLTGDLNFGANFGIISKYYKSISSNISLTGILRLANSDAIGWRNAGNTADILLQPNADGILKYGGVDLVNLSATQTLTTKTFDSTSTMTGVKIASFTPDGTHTLTAPTVTDTIAAIAAIQTLTNKTLGSSNVATGITMASWTPDGSHTLTAPSVTDTLVTLAAAQTLTNKTIAGGSNTITGLTNAMLSGAAGITNANLAAMTALTIKANVTGGSATPTDSTLSAVIDACISSTRGGVLYRGASGWALLSPGTSGFALTSGGAGADPSYANVLTNPMTTLGDIILGASGGAAARLAVGSNGQSLAADSTATNGISYQEPFNDYNFLVNSGFDYWQVGTSATVTATGGATPTASYLYQADQWYANNILGGGTIEGIITFSQQAASLDSSGFAAQLKITTAPTGTGIQNGCELYQVLSNAASRRLYNKTASFSIQVKSLGNVTQVGVQFYYATSEAKLTTAIGSEVLTTVSSGGYTVCKISGQALGTSQTVSGVIGVRIRPTAVSTGNLYDLNNGFQVEQAILNLGPVAHTWHRQFENPVQEIAASRFFYRKSYGLTTNPATSTLIGMLFTGMAGAGTFTTANTSFDPMRIVPTMSYWDGAGNATKYSTFSGGAWAQTNNVGAVTEITASQSGFMFRVSATSLAGGIHWVADSRI